MATKFSYTEMRVPGAQRKVLRKVSPHKMEFQPCLWLPSPYTPHNSWGVGQWEYQQETTSKRLQCSWGSRMLGHPLLSRWTLCSRVGQMARFPIPCSKYFYGSWANRKTKPSAAWLPFYIQYTASPQILSCQSLPCGGLFSLSSWGPSSLFYLLSLSSSSPNTPLWISQSSFVRAFWCIQTLSCKVQVLATQFWDKSTFIWCIPEQLWSQSLKFQSLVIDEVVGDLS